MRAISHATFVQMLQRRMAHHNMSLRDVATKTGLNYAALVAAWNGSAPITPRIAAAFGYLFETDFGTPLAQYMIGRYADAFVKMQQGGEKPAPAKRGEERDLRFLMKQILGNNPSQPVGDMVAELVSVGVPLEMAQEEVIHVSNTARTGEYGNERNSANAV